MEMLVVQNCPSGYGIVASAKEGVYYFFGNFKA